MKLNMMIITGILIFTLFLASFATSFGVKIYAGPVDILNICGDEGCRWGLLTTPTCTNDKRGFVTVQCEWGKRDWDLNSKVTYTKCPENQECVCNRKCCHADLICQDKDERDPQFPKTGVLTYTGSTGWNMDGFTEDEWTGKTVLDENGRFYAEYRDYRHGPGWVQRFLIVLPSDDGYKKITGWLGNKECWMEDINQHPWLYRNYRGRPMVGNKKIFEGEENGKYIQKWWNIHYDKWWHALGEYDNVTYTYNYDVDNNLAIPLKYDHYFQYEDADRRDIKNYVYSSTIEDETVFDVNKYCKTFHSGNGGVHVNYLTN